MMWNGSVADIPTGWVVCDGASTYVDISGATKTVPDLSGRFALGAGAGDGLTVRIPRLKGGAETVTLTKEQLAKHSHLVNDWDDSGQANKKRWNVTHRNAYYSREQNQSGTGEDSNALFDSTSAEEGSDQAHENMPPYYVLFYICYTGVGLA